jgi:hypothetical protein
MASSISNFASAPARVLLDSARLVALAALWIALWSFFLVAVAEPAARLHAFGAPRAQHAVASAAFAEEVRP